MQFFVDLCSCELRTQIFVVKTLILRQQKYNFQLQNAALSVRQKRRGKQIVQFEKLL